MKTIDIELFEKFLEVNFITGKMVWKIRSLDHFKCAGNMETWNKKFAGEVAGKSKTPKGYHHFSLNYQAFYCHRVIYALYHGDPNPPIIDHFDGNPENNSISNLRPVNSEGNSRNMKKFSTNTTGVTGVVLYNNASGYCIKIGDPGRPEYFRYTVTKDFFEAVCIRKSWEISLGYSLAHGVRV